VPELPGIESRTLTLWGVVWVVGITGSLYGLFGGLRTVTVSALLNGIGLLTGGVLFVIPIDPIGSMFNLLPVYSRMLRHVLHVYLMHTL